jgi:hypothetical protein
MRKAFRLALFGALLLALPLAAEEQKTAAASANELPTLSALAGAVLKSCPPAPQICTEDPICTPSYSCDRTYDSISFIRQKDNGMCVYRCTYSESCHDTSTCHEPDTFNTGAHRVRIGPYDPGACPAADINFCTGGEWIPDGAE